jgi:MTH538 TIR-like domain (DUF1863)
MARRVFFSFHYERDIWRVNPVRNSQMIADKAGFIDSANWEKLKKTGNDAIKKWINEQLDGTSVTVVLIGAETASRDWVDYEIKESYKRGNGLVGIYIHNNENQEGQKDDKGKNPLDRIGIKYDNGTWKPLSSWYKTYDWKDDDGFNNIESWIEQAAKEAGR